MTAARSLALAAVAAVAVAACSGPAAPETTAGPDTTAAPTTAAPTTAAPPTTGAPTTTGGGSDDLASGSGCTPGEGPLPDGEWFGYVASADPAMVEFDLACWFTGEAAAEAAAEDGEESPPPNDYYVRNANPATREVTVGEEADVVFYPDGDPTNEQVVPYEEWIELRERRGYDLGVWLEVEGGEIASLREQWVP